MKKSVFTGSGVAIITPFKDGHINFDKFEELIEFQIKNGSDAIVVCASTGEASTIPDDEHKELIKFTVEKVNGRVAVIAGAGSNDTNHAIELSKYAEYIGADAVLSVIPYYNKPTQEGLYKHFKLIADSVKIPIILYNVPSRTNVNISPNTVKRLSEIENIVGIKECNFAQVGEIIKLCDEDFYVYSGEDGLILPLLALGGKGVISVMANMIPKDTHDIVLKFLSGDIEGSRKIQLKTLDLSKALFIESSPSPIKTAMNLMGMDVGECRMPLVEMEKGNIEILKDVMSEYGLKLIN